MTDINYPPSTAWTLEAAASAVADRIDELEAIDERSDEQASELSTRRNQHKALQWARREWGADAEIELEAFTVGKRDRVVDTLNNTRTPPIGMETTQTWLLAGAIERAPWLDGGESLQEQVDHIKTLPPALHDWLHEQLDDVGDLSEGN